MFGETCREEFDNFCRNYSIFVSSLVLNSSPTITLVASEQNKSCFYTSPQTFFPKIELSQHSNSPFFGNETIFPTGLLIRTFSPRTILSVIFLHFVFVIRPPLTIVFSSCFAGDRLLLLPLRCRNDF